MSSCGYHTWIAIAVFSIALCGFTRVRGADPDPGIRILEIRVIEVANETALSVEFGDTGTAATSYQLESAAELGPAGVVSWSEIPGTVPTPLGNGRYRFDVTAPSPNQGFLRIRTGQTAPDDTDRDGLPDDWERQHFGNLDALGIADADGDGYSNFLEHQNRSDPRDRGSQPAIPLVQFASRDVTVSEEVSEAVLPLSLNRPAGATLQFEILGTATENLDFAPVALSQRVVGTQPQLLVRIVDDDTFEPIEWLKIRLLDAGGYAVGAQREVTVRLLDNEQRWTGSISNTIGEFLFELNLTRSGTTMAGHVASVSDLIPEVPALQSPLSRFTRTLEGDGQLEFESAWLPLPSGTSPMEGVSHVRVRGSARGTNGRFASGEGRVEFGSPAQGPIASVGESLELARQPLRPPQEGARLTATR